MKELEDFKLRENPFQHITPIPGRGGIDTPWAGHKVLKENIEGIYKRLFNNPPRQIVLNWGPYGGGKTFAAYKFLEKRRERIDLHQTYVRSPKQGNSADKELYKSLIGFISYKKIKRQIQKLINELGEDGAFDFISNKIRSEEIAEAILRIGSQDEAISKLMKRYVFEGLTRTELKEVDLPKNIDWGTDSIEFLSGIIHCFIGDQEKIKGRFVLWIDEMEDMIYYSQKEYRAFSQVLRDLFDSINQHFLVLLNFTLAEPEEDTIELLLGAALWSRINKKIRFKELSNDEALEYCSDLISHYHTENGLSSYMPFSEDIINGIIRIIPSNSLTPREINRYCGEVLNFAMENDHKKITLNTVNECLEKIRENE
ncbi:MAG: hypothetical protein OXH57_02635 [Ekhidna sp.]|nr:hypothetical protein [Ekhidna sp.]